MSSIYLQRKPNLEKRLLLFLFPHLFPSVYTNGITCVLQALYDKHACLPSGRWRAVKRVLQT